MVLSSVNKEWTSAFDLGGAVAEQFAVGLVDKVEPLSGCGNGVGGFG